MDTGIRYWLALGRVKGLERVSLEKLLENSSPAEIFSSNGAGLEHLSPAFAAGIREFKDWGRIDKELELIERHGCRVITYADPLFPPALKRTYDPPCLLYVKGAVYDPDLPAVAVVGTRRPSHYGLLMAETVSRDLARAGVVVVSGMARGCDVAAHRGALSVNGITAAVLGTGIDIVYPKENVKLYSEILDKGGLLISEYPISTPPLPHNFPRRNRIISGLSSGVLVAEAPVRSGSLMTARLALEYGREVFAIPGQVSSLKSSGTNKLIKDGAHLAEGAEDILNVLGIRPKEATEDAASTARPDLSGNEALVFKAIGTEPVHMEGIIEKTGLSAAAASALLLEMELKGYIEQRPGKYFQRRS